jgi:putative transcriptional regulator
MKANAQKLELAMANACMNPYDLCREANMKYQAYHRIMKGANLKPATIGRLAKALGVSVEDIIETDAATSEGNGK